MKIKLQRTDEELFSLANELHTLEDLANILEIEPHTLRYYSMVKTITTNYRAFRIPKKSGGVRMIFAPNTSLKIIQQKLNHILQIIYHKYAPRSVHGFVYGKSIITNAEQHVGRKYVFNLDIDDFFPSIKLSRVQNTLRSWPYSQNLLIANLISKLVCFGDFLPQGAPTSPVISNMVCVDLDHQLLTLAQNHGCTYT